MFQTYFSARYILNIGALINIAFSDRSDGKTFDCKFRALEDYEKDKSQTIYMRRFKTEITEQMYANFFNEVLDKEVGAKYKNWLFKGSRKGIQVKTSIKEDWDWIIFFVPLSVSARMKSQFSEISRIHMIDYDEYFPLDGIYLPKEMDLLLEFWKSIDRDRETTQLFIAGNRISPFCPIFDYFGIDMQITKDKIKTYRNDTLAVQIYSNKEHREKRKVGKFRQLIKDTPYEEYDGGGVLKTLDLNIRTRNGLDYCYSFKTERGEGSAWYNNGIMVISEHKRKDGICLCDKMYNNGRQNFLCTYGRFGQNLKSIYRSGNMFFETEKAFYLFEKILTKVGSM